MATTETRSKPVSQVLPANAVAPYLFFLTGRLMGTLYKPAVRDELTYIGEAMDVINLVKNRKGEYKAEARN